MAFGQKFFWSKLGSHCFSDEFREFMVKICSWEKCICPSVSVRPKNLNTCKMKEFYKKNVWTKRVCFIANLLEWFKMHLNTRNKCTWTPEIWGKKIILSEISELYFLAHFCIKELFLDRRLPNGKQDHLK